MKREIYPILFGVKKPIHKNYADGRVEMCPANSRFGKMFESFIARSESLLSAQLPFQSSFAFPSLSQVFHTSTMEKELVENTKGKSSGLSKPTRDQAYKRQGMAEAPLLTGSHNRIGLGFT